MPVDPKLLKDYTALAVEIAQDEAALAQKKARHKRLEAQILEVQAAEGPHPDKSAYDHLTDDQEATPALPWGPGDVRPSRAIAQVVEVVVALGGEATTKGVAEKLGITGSAASIRLARAVTAGLLRKVAFGTYALVHAPRTSP